MKSQEKLLKVTLLTLTLSLAFIPYITTHATNNFYQKNTQQINHNLPRTQDDATLIIDISPALCQLSKNYAKFRQCADGKNYVIRSLIFTNQKVCHINSKPNLSPLQESIVQRLIPDKKMQLQAWQHHGACSGLTANRYFRQIIQQGNNLSLTNEFNGKNYQISQRQLRKNIISHNKHLTGKKLQFLCHSTQQGNTKIQLLTQIRICGDNNQCNKTPIDKADKYAQYTKECTEKLLTITKP